MMSDAPDAVKSGDVKVTVPMINVVQLCPAAIVSEVSCTMQVFVCKYHGRARPPLVAEFALYVCANAVPGLPRMCGRMTGSC